MWYILIIGLIKILLEKKKGNILVKGTMSLFGWSEKTNEPSAINRTKKRSRE